jgi:hypothetical protein
LNGWSKALTRRFPDREDPVHLRRVRRMPCLLQGKSRKAFGWRGMYAKSPDTAIVTHICAGHIEAHHVVSKGRGGHDRQTVPLCTKAHGELHSRGKKTFERHWGLDLLTIAEQIGAT